MDPRAVRVCAQPFGIGCATTNCDDHASFFFVEAVETRFKRVFRLVQFATFGGGLLVTVVAANVTVIGSLLAVLLLVISLSLVAVTKAVVVLARPAVPSSSSRHVLQ